MEGFDVTAAAAGAGLVLAPVLAASEEPISKDFTSALRTVGTAATAGAAAGVGAATAAGAGDGDGDGDAADAELAGAAEEIGRAHV